MIIKLAHADVGHRMRLARIAFLVTLAALGCLLLPAGNATAATAFSSFDAGTLAPRQVVHKVWNNANSDAYAVGLVTKTPTGDDCRATLTRTWYERRTDGISRFHMMITGDWIDECQVTVWLARPTALTSMSISGVAPGASVTKVWRYVQPVSNVYLVGAKPSTPTSGTCAFEVKSRYRALSHGEFQFVYTSTNIGTATCSATLNLIVLPVTRSDAMPPFNPGEWFGFERFFSSPKNVVVPGLVPWPVTNGTFEYTLDPDTSFRRDKVEFGYTNTGSAKCRLNLTWAEL